MLLAIEIKIEIKFLSFLGIIKKIEYIILKMNYIFIRKFHFNHLFMDSDPPGLIFCLKMGNGLTYYIHQFIFY